MKSLRIPCGMAVGEIANLHLAVDLHWPDDLKHPAYFLCLPGGGMQRQFFDLAAPGFSFVQAMLDAGFACVTVDHPGIGESDQPEDGYVLTPHLVADVHAALCTVLDEHVPELAGLKRIGVGHSMGAMISVIQQAAHASHEALLLLGFGLDGLPKFLPPQAQALLDDRESLMAQSPELAKGMFGGKPYPMIAGASTAGDLYGRSTAEAEGVAALKDVVAPLLPVPAFCSMFPHQWDADAAKIDVPVLLALGDKDLVKAPDNVDQVFAASAAAELMVLPETGHSQFLFPSRHDLFARVAQWAAALAA